MARTCSTGLHSPSTDVVRNQGFEFTRCRHCASDLIRSNRRWRTVPRGFRVVWRGQGRPLGEDPAQLQLDLSPASRALVLRGSDHPSIWRLGAVLGLAIAGLFYLLWAAADHLRDGWKRITRQRLRPKVLRLPTA